MTVCPVPGCSYPAGSRCALAGCPGRFDGPFAGNANDNCVSIGTFCFDPHAWLVNRRADNSRVSPGADGGGFNATPEPFDHARGDGAERFCGSLSFHEAHNGQ